MPLSLNALLGIPTREEKFTAARDQKMQYFNKELLGERERIRREGDKYDWTEGKARLTSILAGSGQWKPEEVDAAVNQALSSPQVANIYKAREIAGGMPYAGEVGATGAQSTLEGNKASTAESKNKGLFASTLSKYIPSLASTSAEADVSGNLARKEVGLLTGDKAVQDRAIVQATGPDRMVAELTDTRMRPVIARQNEAMGNIGVERGKTTNEMLGRENLQAERLEGELSTLYDKNPDMLTAPIRAQAAEADRTIEMSKAIREALADPMQRPYILKMIRAANQIGGWQQSMPDGVNSMSPSAANDPMIQGLARFIKLPTQ